MINTRIFCLIQDDLLAWCSLSRLIGALNNPLTIMLKELREGPKICKLFEKVSIVYITEICNSKK